MALAMFMATTDAEVRAALPAIMDLCPRDLVKTTQATVLNVADAIAGPSAISYRTTVRAEVSRQLARLWRQGFLLALNNSGNELQHEVRRALPPWDGKGGTGESRATVKAVRAGLEDGIPVAMHLDRGLAFLDAADVVMRAVGQFAIEPVDVVRRRQTWQRHVDVGVPPGHVRTAMLRMFRFGLAPALRARRAASPALARALPEDRVWTEAEAMRRNALDVVGALANVIPGARFDSLEATVDGRGRIDVVPSFGDGRMDLRLPLSHEPVAGSTEVMGGLLRSDGGAWGYSSAARVVEEVTARAPDAERGMVALWRTLSADPSLHGFAFCVMGPRELLAGPRLGRGAPDASRLARVVAEAAAHGVVLSLGLGASITIGQARAFGEWEVDRAAGVARLSPA